MVRTFLEEQTLQEIGDIWGVTEARVCQIRNRALQNLRARLGALVDRLPAAAAAPTRDARRGTRPSRRAARRARVHKMPAKKKPPRREPFELAEAA